MHEHFSIDQPALTGRITFRDRDRAAGATEDQRPTSESVPGIRIRPLLRQRALYARVRALPREAGADRTAVLAGLAEGLKWRELDRPGGLDFCDAAKAEARTELLAAWKGAGHSCTSDR